MGQALSSLQKLSASKVATMTIYGKDLYLTFQKKKSKASRTQISSVGEELLTFSQHL